MRQILGAKYGEKYVKMADANVDNCVNPRVLFPSLKHIINILSQIIHKLAISTPDATLVLGYLTQIANANGIKWEPNSTINPIFEPLPVPGQQGFHLR